ncbi:UDP-N-acetylenolpyruvoylglucosamine reductase MurB [Helicobacter sp. NHP19-003]|uniref:UDP-N-acetylenolpyruvoylglucosamine reductase n=1 Tax=Helicobacter gastrocanis TaxID=2849641 RepID=A0ABN6I264_9HELI|nr:UDP-N-acetylmuramate dehydrogenase [Helicobacter sp. NHP19-003]BCZ17077.1 UDP-N-acetylenolpyruvoylglucosamine reductase MurB [Helicobacter sp. NHP19-003]
MLIDFGRYSSVKIGGVVQVRVLDTCAPYVGVQMVGLASNLLVSPEAKNLATLSKSFDYIVDLGTHLEVGAKTNAQKLFSYYKNHDLQGLEFLSALPGSLGGLVKMNAGMKAYEIKEFVEALNINGEWVEAKDLGFGYRTSGVRGVVFKARLKKRKGFRHGVFQECQRMRCHPKKPSFGSCFKNPVGDFAGRLLEAVGLKGFSLGGVGFSREHANFLVNLGGGRFEEALRLIALAKERVFDAFGIALEEEVCIYH